MLDIQRRIGVVGKASKTSGGGKFDYRGVDAVVAECHPHMADVGVLCIQHKVERDDSSYTTSNGVAMHLCTVTITYHFYAEDGSFIEHVTVGAGSDTGDKAAACAQTQAYRSALCHAFSIPTQPPEEADSGPRQEQRHQGKSQGGAPPQQSEAQKAPQQERHDPATSPGGPVFATKLRAEIMDRVGELNEGTDKGISEAEIEEQANYIERDVVCRNIGYAKGTRPEDVFGRDLKRVLDAVKVWQPPAAKGESNGEG
jgi:hypothetical protein